MARLARVEVFAPDEVAIVHVMNRVVRRCFLLQTNNGDTAPVLTNDGRNLQSSDSEAVLRPQRCQKAVRRDS